MSWLFVRRQKTLCSRPVGIEYFLTAYLWFPELGHNKLHNLAGSWSSPRALIASCASPASGPVAGAFVGLADCAAAWFACVMRTIRLSPAANNFRIFFIYFPPMLGPFSFPRD